MWSWMPMSNWWIVRWPRPIEAFPPKTVRTAAKILPFVPVIFLAVVAVAAPSLPVINTNNIIVITNAVYGAVGDGVTTNTTAIQNAINVAAAGGTTNGAAGGTVEIPAGTFLSGPLTLKNGVNLQIDSGALLQMLPLGSWPGTTTFINGASLHDVEISGAGAIDGQGAAWWSAFNTNGISRPNFIQFSSSQRILIQNVTLQNPPTFHVMIKNNNANITVQGITINTPGNSPNTDGFDIASTNVLIQNCSVSDGDDNVEIGGSQPAAEITVTNCAFGTGHGVSIGSITSGGVSNLLVIDCTFNNTINGIRLKSDNAGSGGGSGGLVQNLSYLNIGMTNVDFPITIYSYYNEVGTPDNITPVDAATQTVAAVTATTPIWRNLIFSNLTATAVSGYPAAIIWARTELPATNIVLDRVNLTAAEPVEIYNASGVQIINSQFTLPSGTNTFELFNAQITVTNSSPATNLTTLDGLTANGYGNSLAFYNAPASLKNTNVLNAGPLTLGGSQLTISNNLTLFPATVLNFSLGTNATGVAVTGNLALGGTNNIFAGAGFTNGSYTLLACAGTLSGNLPALGTTPTNYNLSFNTNTAGQVNLVVTLPAPPAPANLIALATNLAINLKWNSVGTATGYNLKRGTVSGIYPTVFSGLTATNYADANVTNAVDYFYVVTAVAAGSESTNSSPASAVPLPSADATNLVAQTIGGQLQLSWPQDHLGWRLQIQTNNLNQGIGTNWIAVSASQLTNQLSLPIMPATGAVFLRLIYP